MLEFGLNNKNKILFSNGDLRVNKKKKDFLLLLLNQILDVQQS